MSKIYSEKYLEKKLREEVKKLGGLALKFQSSSYTGLPDRLILMPNGKIFWAEIKTTGEKLSQEQESRKAMLEKMGFKVFVIDNKSELDYCLSEIDMFIRARKAVDNYLQGDDDLIERMIRNEV